MLVQLDPPLSLDTPKGPGLAILVNWLSIEEHLLWTVIQDKTGEIWTWPNPQVRGQKNIQAGRIIDNKHLIKERLDQNDFAKNT